MKNQLLKTVAAALLIAASGHSSAADERIEFCSISGFASGYHDILTSRLAMRLARDMMETAACHGAFRAAQATGKRVFDLKPLNYGDKELVQAYNAFTKKIDDVLLPLIGGK